MQTKGASAYGLVLIVVSACASVYGADDDRPPSPTIPQVEAGNDGGSSSDGSAVLEPDAGDGSASSDATVDAGVDAAVECPINGKLFQGHCYFLLDELLIQPDAKAACVKAHAHLVTISSQDENNEMKALAATKGTDSWIGLESLAPSADRNAYRWITEEPTTYSSWENDQPNAESICVAQNPGKGWADRDCNDHYHPICERE